MTNVIQFPTFERLKQVINEKIDNEIEKTQSIETQKEECVELAYYCFDLMEQAIKGNEFIDGFEDMNFNDVEDNCRETHDMTAVINLLTAMFYRYKGLEHVFQEDLDNILNKLDSIIEDDVSKLYSEELKLEETEIETLLTEESDDTNDTD